jgi:hypothetical protein
VLDAAPLLFDGQQRQSKSKHSLNVYGTIESHNGLLKLSTISRLVREHRMTEKDALLLRLDLGRHRPV